MDAHSESPSAADLVGWVGALNVGLGTLTFQLFPFALPLIILVVGPLAVVAVAGLLLALPIMLPLWLGRRLLHARRRPPQPGPVRHQPSGQLARPAVRR
jgi:membrane protein implicated in regulation of membrane protease activity